MAEDHIPTAEEYALFREAYAQTYPVRPLLNAIDAKDAEIERLRRQIELLNAHPPLLVDGDTITPLLGASDDEIEALEEENARLREALEEIATLDPLNCVAGPQELAREALRNAHETPPVHKHFWREVCRPCTTTPGLVTHDCECGAELVIPNSKVKQGYRSGSAGDPK